jgi:hypothetical protein
VFQGFEIFHKIAGLDAGGIQCIASRFWQLMKVLRCVIIDYDNQYIPINVKSNAFSKSPENTGAGKNPIASFVWIR